MNSPRPRQLHEPVWALWVGLGCAVLAVAALVIGVLQSAGGAYFGAVALAAAAACFISVGLPSWRRVRAQADGGR
jgi:hypothetical protein